MSPEGFDLVRDEIREKLEKLEGPDGEPLGNAVYTPAEVYASCAGVPPDLLLYPGDLRWRCAETVGHEDVFLTANDTGPDSANHSWEGLFILQDPQRPGLGRTEGAHILDVAPTLLECMGLPIPGRMQGGRVAGAQRQGFPTNGPADPSRPPRSQPVKR